MRTITTTIAVVTTGLLALTACTSDDTAASTTTVPPTPTPTSTVAQTSTTDPSALTAPDTTEATTTSPSTTASTVPPEPTDAEVQEVVDAMVATWTAFNESKLDPTNDDKLEALRRLTDDALEERLVGVILRNREINYASRTNDEVPATIVVDQSSVTIDKDSAAVDYCELNTNILVEVGAGPNGIDATVDDGVHVSYSRTTFTRIGDDWVATGGETFRTVDGATACEE